jgi:hypothetical protein
VASPEPVALGRRVWIPGSPLSLSSGWPKAGPGIGARNDAAYDLNFKLINSPRNRE